MGGSVEERGAEVRGDGRTQRGPTRSSRATPLWPANSAALHPLDDAAKPQRPQRRGHHLCRPHSVSTSSPLVQLSLCLPHYRIHPLVFAMAAFSGAVKLADLNDYLGPSQSCVKPMMKPKDDEKSGPIKLNHNQGPTVRIEMEVDVRSPPRSSTLPVVGRGAHFAQMREDREKKTATVSLNDCLACSGCVTSAETVLIQQQSLDQLKQVLQSMRDPPPSPPSPPPRLMVMSLSPQSRASLAHHFSLSPLDTARRLTTFIHSLGISDLFDASSTLDFSLLEAQREFVSHFRATRTPSSPSHSPSSSPLPLPLLTSECPGWVCYAEKTQGAYILPHMSKVKSPQQVMGTLLKHWWSAQHGVSPVDVYHVSVQPCFDKKLEVWSHSSSLLCFTLRHRTRR